MGAGKLNAGGSSAMDYHPIQGGVEILLIASCNRISNNLGLSADFTLPN